MNIKINKYGVEIITSVQMALETALERRGRSLCQIEQAK